jgi:hypothetical protein
LIGLRGFGLRQVTSGLPMVAANDYWTEKDEFPAI